MENNVGIKFDDSDITVEEFMKTRYKEYWQYSNKDGKNAIDAYEQLPEVVRKIIYACYMINVRVGDERKTVQLAGQVSQLHAHGDASIQDSIKGVASAWKSQPATRLLQGIGNFGDSPSSDGAAARYTAISGTPLLTAIYKDIPYVPTNSDDTGIEQPNYVSCPIPMGLINGVSPIGTGRSCYLTEREAHEVIKWIDALRLHNWSIEEAEKAGVPEPKPYSFTGCKTWYEPSNGYIYYEAVVHYGVNMNDITKKGKYDVITNLPPKSNSDIVITKLRNKLPTRVTNKIVDGSGKGRPTWIIVPTGYLDEKDFAKYSMRSARKEQVYIWDHQYETMRKAGIIDIACEWFEDRSRIVSMRLNEQMIKLKANNHKIDLIKAFSEEKMINWKSEEVVDYFVNLAVENNFTGFEIDDHHKLIVLAPEDAGKKDANTVLSLSARTFLPENVSANELVREKNDKAIAEIEDEIKNIGDVIIREANEIIDAQEKFFKTVENN